MLAKDKRKIVFFSKTLLAITFILFFFSNVYCETIDDYQDQLNNLLKQQKETVNKLTGIDKEIAQDQYDMLELDTKVVKYTEELNNLQAKVNEINQKLANYTKALDNSGQAYSEAEVLYTKRLRSIYENGFPTITEMFLKSEGIGQFFRKMSVYTSIIEYDKSIIGNLQSQKQYIDYVKKDIEAQKLQLEKLKTDKEKSNQSLNDARAAKESKVNSLQNSKVDLQARLEAINKQREDADKKIDDEIERIRQEALEKARSAAGSAITFSGGQFAWAVPGYNMITTKFNVAYDPWGIGKTTVHMGVDVAGGGINGQPIVAMQDGIVTVARYYGAYGNCVIINHGTSATDGNYYMSLYGHSSALNVTEGQKVLKGDTIAYVGSTGNSTGPHLHLELHRGNASVNGGKTERVDPLLYFSDISFVYL